MNITKKFAGIVCIAAAVVGALSLFMPPFLALILVDLFLAALVLSDYLMSNRQINIEVKRTGTNKLSINEKEKISFEIYNKSSYTIEMDLIDDIPDYHFEVMQPDMKVYMKSGEKIKLYYEVIPRKRGAFEFGNLHVRIKGKMGLYYRYGQIALKREYKVYPNLMALKKYRLSMYKNILEREGKKLVKNVKQGTSFESLREYVNGDEYRKINWAASARSNKPIVNQYEPEKNQRIYAFIDAGRPMSYILKGECMLDKAINTAMVLSDTVTRNGDLAGLLCFNEKILDAVMPGKGSGHRDKMMESLYHIQSSNATSDYEDAFLYFREKERRKSIIFMFTDFDTFEEADIIARSAAAIGREHILVVVLMKNEKIYNMAEKQALREEEIYDKAAALEQLEERKRSIARLNRKNVMCIEVEPEKLELSVISKYIELKSRLGV